MQAVATVRPRSHSLTSYYVKLCSCACVNVLLWLYPSVIAAHLPVVSSSWGLVTAGSPQRLTLLYTFSLCLPATLFSTRAIGKEKRKKKQKKSFAEVCRLFSSIAFESVNEPPVWLPPMFSQNSFGAAQHFASLR